jgi:hypothetical protein
VRNYLALVGAANHVDLLPTWVRVMERSGKVLPLGAGWLYRILCPWVSSNLSVDSGWPIREFSVYGSHWKSVIVRLNRAVVKLPAGSYAGDACRILRRACDEHVSCGVPTGPTHCSAKSTLRGAYRAYWRRFGDEFFLKRG